MKIFEAIAKYLPFVLQGVVTVETVISGASGKTKKDIVLSALSAGAKVGASVPEDHVQIVSTLIDTVVGAFNQSGLFAHTAPAAK